MHAALRARVSDLSNRSHDPDIHVTDDKVAQAACEAQSSRNFTAMAQAYRRIELCSDSLTQLIVCTLSSDSARSCSHALHLPRWLLLQKVSRRACASTTLP